MTPKSGQYLTWQMQNGATLDLTSSLDEVLAAFFTFVVGIIGFGVVRDPIACKPAVMAETDQYIAFGSNTAPSSTTRVENAHLGTDARPSISTNAAPSSAEKAA
jgi:hypothetical protein